MNQVLFGWFTIPDTTDRPLEFFINPLGNRARSEKRVWNDGQQRLKLVSSATAENDQLALCSNFTGVWPVWVMINQLSLLCA